MERVNSTTGVLQPGTIHYPTAQQIPLLSDKLVARMDDRARVKMRGKREGKRSGRRTDWLSLRNSGCLSEEGWMRGEGEEGWTDGGVGRGRRAIAADHSLYKWLKNSLNK